MHAEAPCWEATDWPQIVALYDLLLRHDDTPVVRLNRLIAVAATAGPRAALAEAEPLHDALAGYHLYHATRAELLRALGRGPMPTPPTGRRCGWPATPPSGRSSPPAWPAAACARGGPQARALAARGPGTPSPVSVYETALGCVRLGRSIGIAITRLMLRANGWSLPPQPVRAGKSGRVYSRRTPSPGRYRGRGGNWPRRAAVDPLAVRFGVPVRPVGLGGPAVAGVRLLADPADETWMPGHEGVGEPGFPQRGQACGRPLASHAR